MKRFLNIIWCITCCWGISVVDGYGQNRKVQMQQKQVVTSQKDAGTVGSKAVVAIEKFIKPTAQRYTGMFNVYVQEGRYFVEIPNRLMGRDILAMQVLAKGSAQNVRATTQLLGYAGDPLSSRMIRFVRGEGDEVWLIEPKDGVFPTDTKSEYYRLKQVTGNNPISMVFEVKAKGKESVLIDMTNVLAADNNVFSMKDMKQTLGLGSFQADRSYVKGCSVFPDNVIFRLIKCYGAGAAPQLSSFDKGSKNKVVQNPTVWELAVSLVLLPEEPMRVRYADKRVGYFLEQDKYAGRFRLEPKPEDMERYKRGELVEPKKPIVFYIDYDFPEFLVEPLIAGVHDWQKAFERAGFKNAITAKRMPRPEENPDFSPEDARYSIISYKASPIGNAFGLRMTDPRSGEVICAKISVLYGVQQLLQKWYFAQASVVDERAQHIPFNEELVGQLVRYLVSHEVGHTLGLRHNFLSSNFYTVDQLRNKNYVRKNGHTASIMDYARFNYVAQPGDGIAAEDMIPRIGEYDLFAVEWGYRLWPDIQDVKEEQRFLEAWITKQRKENEMRLFGTEYDSRDPRFQSGDLGDNNMKADELGMKNLQVIAKNIESWTGENDPYFKTFTDLYMGLCDQYLDYIRHVVKNVGGRYLYDKLRSEGAGFYKPVRKKQQKEALAFLDRHFFHTPEWLFADELTSKAGMSKVRVMRMLYGMQMKQLVSITAGILENEEMGCDYTLKEYMDDMYRLVFTEAIEGKAVTPCRKELQQAYTSALKKAMGWELTENATLVGVLFGQLERIKADAGRMAEKSENVLAKEYWKSLAK